MQVSIYQPSAGYLKSGSLGLSLGAFVAAIARPKIQRVGQLIALAGSGSLVAGVMLHPIPDGIESMTGGTVSLYSDGLPFIPIVAGAVMPGGGGWSAYEQLDIAREHPREACMAMGASLALADAVRVLPVGPSVEVQDLAARVAYTAFTVAVAFRLAQLGSPSDDEDSWNGASSMWQGYRLGRSLNAIAEAMEWRDPTMHVLARKQFAYNVWCTCRIYGELFNNVFAWFRKNVSGFAPLELSVKPLIEARKPRAEE